MRQDRGTNGHFGILAPSGLEIWHVAPCTQLAQSWIWGAECVFSCLVLQRLAWLVAGSRQLTAFFEQSQLVHRAGDLGCGHSRLTSASH